MDTNAMNISELPQASYPCGSKAVLGALGLGTYREALRLVIRRRSFSRVFCSLRLPLQEREDIAIFVHCACPFKPCPLQTCREKRKTLRTLSP